MPYTGIFSTNDIQQIQSRGLTVLGVESQLRILSKGPKYLDMDRACTLGDGIRFMGPDDLIEYGEKYDQALSDIIPCKFVPASGAASRMFRDLLAWHNTGEDCDAVREIFDRITDLPFWPHMVQDLAKTGQNAENLAREGAFSTLVDCMLSSKHLNLADSPKGLIPFHRYKDHCRTPFEEHLHGAAEFARDRQNICRLHLTVTPNHQNRFEELFSRVRKDLERSLAARFLVDYSIQEPSTDTIASGEDNMPFRNADGSLFFRPGGHGALLSNLNSMDADVVFINNIDNVVLDRNKKERALWKKALAGLLLDVRSTIFSYLDALKEKRANGELLREIAKFTEQTLSLVPPKPLQGSELQSFLLQHLNRPLRVCGMVKNLGDPGGAPFWIREPDGMLSLQIVESAQINPNSPRQNEIFNSSTHFNPVEVVCSMKAHQGGQFDLHEYVDPDTVFVSHKSKDGKPLNALELPGLWNGSMARWNTIFVDVSIQAFNPVKTVNDLLKPSHQPA